MLTNKIGSQPLTPQFRVRRGVICKGHVLSVYQYKDMQLFCVFEKNISIGHKIHIVLGSYGQNKKLGYSYTYKMIEDRASVILSPVHSSDDGSA